MVQLPQLDSQSATPLYRQLYESLRASILSGTLADGDKLPPTRDLAAKLNLNRATVSAAYDLLHAEGLLSGQVGRGSYVQTSQSQTTQPISAEPGQSEISFSTSRPSADLFPLDDFRAIASQVLTSHTPQVLQLGSPLGYGPLRDYLIAEATAEGSFDPATDDLLVTSGCQQALDLLHRTLFQPGDRALTADPVYPGLRNAFGPTLTADPATPNLTATVTTPSFQNPTGHTLSLTDRRALLDRTAASGQLVLEIDIYSRLRYTGDPLPPLRALGDKSRILTLRSFSKIAFPGLRVGWILGPRALIQRLAQTKQWTDLHSDQLSQAIMLEFARSGRLAAHLDRVLASGRQSLSTALATLDRTLPPGSSFTRPEGGMNLWVTLPPGSDAAAVLDRARRLGVSYLPGRYFALSPSERPWRESFRLCFAGLSPALIAEGLRRLKPLFDEEAQLASRPSEFAPQLAMV